MSRSSYKLAKDQVAADQKKLGLKARGPQQREVTSEGERWTDTCSSEMRRKQVCLVMGAGTRGCKRLGSVCLMEFPKCLQSKGCLLSFLREKVARLEPEVRKSFHNPRGFCGPLPLYLLGLQPQGLPVSKVRKHHENWLRPQQQPHVWRRGCILQKQTGLFE